MFSFIQSVSKYFRMYYEYMPGIMLGSGGITVLAVVEFNSLVGGRERDEIITQK